MHERITIRMTDDMLSRLDTFIASQPGYLSRQELVRRCVELVLDHPEHLSRLADYEAPVVSLRSDPAQGDGQGGQLYQNGKG